MRPLTYCKDGNGRCRWEWSAPSKPRPLYGLDRLAAAPEAYVVVCEGEKAADAAQTLFADRPIVAVSWPGGANGVDVVDLTPLHNRAVAIWPDADEVGRKAARRLCSHLAVKTSETPLILAIPENKPGGWDAADALAEGWSTEDLQCLIREGSRYSSDVVDEPRIFRSRTQFALVPATEIPLKAPEWLIRDLLELDTFACLFGEPSAAKSFLGLNIACCVASGLDFHGHPVRRSPVAYLAGEGFNGIMRRVHAWALRNQCDPRPYLQVSESGAALTDTTGAEEVDEALRQMAESHGAPALIVVDTLARNFGPADENSTQDMNVFINALDAIRRRHNATVLVIHHTGHGDKSRGRGSTALKAGLDAEYRLEKDNKEIIRLESQKMKDAPTPPPRAFQLVSVELPITDEYNRVVTSAVLDEVEWQPRRKKSDSGTYKSQVLAVLDQLLESARENLQESGSPPDQARVEFRTWSDACGQKGIPRRRFSDARKALVDEGSVVQEGSSVFRP